ncbi:efflux transporter outer membrane subunit [Diaphorobacter sp. HDW4A]|uniref:efflux transporter outer membrane subunit n=1 Tax=Diaphorobacter sp. HDW4A TaxID=2714924 RepID=UPI001F110FDB|nr:efflux transporter outer membrane subunit [Diaphorobacter sp. HDW4A]
MIKTMTPMRLSVLSMSLALAACTSIGPDHQSPNPVMDSSFIQPGSPSSNNREVSADIARFWRGFNDQQLTALVERALSANGDVRVAQARLQEARAGLGEAEASGLPDAGINASAERSVQPLTQRPGTSRSERTGNVFDAGFIANWEIDLFGGLRRTREAAAARVDASQVGIAAAQTSVAAEVARYYFDLRGLQQRLQLSRVALEKQREALLITEARANHGRASELDLARARGLVASTESALPALDNSIDRVVLRLATLTAQPARDLMRDLGEPAPLPGLPVTALSALPVGTPQAWLKRRPDLIAAERELAAATADIGVAQAALYPRLSLSGLLGFNAADVGDMLDSASRRWSLGANIKWTPFDGGALRARVRGAEARAQQSLIRFDQALAIALEETEGAFSSFTRESLRAARLEEASRQAKIASTLALLRYEAGSSDFLAVLDAERESLQQQDAYLQAQVSTASALVSVYRSLGGGWEAQGQIDGITLSRTSTAADPTGH